jgi:hypothetical protein
MSFTGTLLSVTDGPPHDRRASGRDGTYPTWRLTVMLPNGKEISACTGRTDIRDRAKELIGQTVHVARGGKEGIVGGVAPVTEG